MLTDKIYKEQMTRLEGIQGRAIIPQSYQVWKKELEDIGCSDKEFIKTADMFVERLQNGKYKPTDLHLGSLQSCLQEARGRLRDLNPKPKPRENIADVIPKRGYISPYAEGCIKIMDRLHAGIIDYKGLKIELDTLSKQHKVGPLYGANR